MPIYLTNRTELFILVNNKAIITYQFILLKTFIIINNLFNFKKIKIQIYIIQIIINT
jgi:hypothetical protein